jgi:hypothetical protein
MKGYKVIKTQNSKLYSVIPELKEGGIEYRLGEKITPAMNCGPLCVFVCLQAAKSFTFYEESTQKNPPKYKIFRCDYKKSNAKSIWYFAFGKYRHETDKRFLCSWTDLAEWVILREEIK